MMNTYRAENAPTIVSTAASRSVRGVPVGRDTSTSGTTLPSST